MEKTLLNLAEESSHRVMDHSFVIRRNKSLGCARADFYLVFGSDFREVSGADFEKATMQSPQYPWRRTFRP